MSRRLSQATATKTKRFGHRSSADYNLEEQSNISSMMPQLETRNKDLSNIMKEDNYSMTSVLN